MENSNLDVRTLKIWEWFGKGVNWLGYFFFHPICFFLLIRDLIVASYFSPDGPICFMVNGM